ncbi:MAG TPA: FAD-binding oxidoreductase [Steroidobacteraceae bacterium]|jgi:FAD/FMN-containing dehydrogenase|nr:FAD-binding oxidoreductase [Steroidobacteraceae bacterium]
MRVPPNVSSADYARALAEFEQAIGREWVFTSDEDLDLYRDAFSPFLNEPEERIASGALAPVSTEQVQQIVRIANKYRIPIYPISTGKNLGYGGSAPAYSGSVVLDLKRMNRIIEVNEQHAFALVEPGVSYFDLYRYIQEHKLKVWIDCPDPGWGSVMGNALDRGGGYTSANYRNHFDSHCGMEIVLPNGELLRTGMGAIPNAQTWQQYKSGCGPWIDGIFSQSNFGVVTKMGFWLMPEPEAYQRCTVSVPRYHDLMPLVEILNFVENSRITSGFPDLESPLLGYPPVGQIQLWNETGPPKMSAEHANLLKGAKLGYSPQIEAYGARAGIPYWRLWLSFHGPEEVIQAQWHAAQRHFARIQGAQFAVVEQVKLPVDAQQATKYHEPEFGVPSLRAFSIGARTPWNPTPSKGHMWFSPIIPRTGEAIIEANRVFSEAAQSLGMPLFTTFTLPACFWERAFIFILATPVTEDPHLNKRYREGFKKLIEVGGQHGWGEYRTAPVFQHAVMDVYSFNNHVLQRFHATLKDAIDPNGILSAGRYDIWPKHLREKA